MRTAVVGGGWAGLATAVRACEGGHAVTLFETAGQLGGRARSVADGDATLDNGQHILIGAYRRTLSLMRTVGVDEAAVLHRRPLELRYPDGRGLRLPAGPAVLALMRGVAGFRGWTWRDRSSFARHALAWAVAGFRCDPSLTVAGLCTGMRPAVRRLLIDPLCVAALNTPADAAAASVLLRVLRDALFAGRGAADLLLPRRGLSDLLPQPAAAWLAAHGAALRLGHRVGALERSGGHWQVDGEPFDAVVVACSAVEAARLVRPHHARWAARAAAIGYEPIVTVYLECPGARLRSAMTALVDTADVEAPAQFAFDLGALGGAPGRFSFVISGASNWVERGTDAIADAVKRQARSAFVAGPASREPRVRRLFIERRATFRCTPALLRPPARIADGLLAAGDYVAGPYPATLEGAVRSGEAAVRSLAER